MNSYLAIDAGGAALTAVLKAGGKYYTFTEPQLRHTSAVLLPAVENLLAEAKITLSDLDCFGVTLGPGSFTGIRVGLVTVKAWAYALGKPCVGVNSLLAGAYITNNPCISLIDGSNGTCYVAAYGADKKEVSPPRCIYAADIPAELKGGFDIVADNSLSSYIDKPFLTVNPAKSLPLAIERGKSQKYDALTPLYIRKSQPERKAGEL